MSPSVTPAVAASSDMVMEVNSFCSSRTLRASMILHFPGGSLFWATSGSSSWSAMATPRIILFQ